VSSIAIAATVLLGTLSGAPLDVLWAAPAHADGLNLCGPLSQFPVISLPADDRPQSVPVECYYTTGHPATLSGKQFGFDTVVFQFAVPTGGFITVGQVAVTDLSNGTFHHQTYVAPGPFPASTNGFIITLPQGLTSLGSSGVNSITASLPDGYQLNLSLSALTNPVYQDKNGAAGLVRTQASPTRVSLACRYRRAV
jgi:hypothetical protein